VIPRATSSSSCVSTIRRGRFFGDLPGGSATQDSRRRQQEAMVPERFRQHPCRDARSGRRRGRRRRARRGQGGRRPRDPGQRLGAKRATIPRHAHSAFHAPREPGTHQPGPGDVRLGRPAPGCGPPPRPEEWPLLPNPRRRLPQRSGIRHPHDLWPRRGLGANIIRAQGCELERLGRRVTLRNPRIVTLETAEHRLPAALRPFFRAADFPGFVLLDEDTHA
jgi:hypothetical protein